MTTVPSTTAPVNLFASEWQAREVAELARYAIRRPGSIATLVADLKARAETPIVNGERAVNRRHWIITDGDGEVLAEAPSLYRAIHSLAR